MSIPTGSATISDFAAMMDRLRATLAEKNTALDALKAERDEITRAAPHTEDIVAVFMRGLESSGKEFERQFQARLEEDFSPSPEAAERAGPTRARDLLTIDAERLDAEALRTRMMRKEKPPINMAALTYPLRHSIETQLPGLVERLFPSAAKGMRGSERVAKLADINARVAELQAEVSGLVAEIEAARQAVLSPR